MQKVNDIKEDIEIGAIIDAGIARREAERPATIKRLDDAERYAAALAEAATLVATSLEATGREVSVDAIFEAAGFKPTGDMRMEAFRAGRRINADRVEALRQSQIEGERLANLKIGQEVHIATFELDRTIKDPKCNLDAIFDAVIALRRVTSRNTMLSESVTFEAAVASAVQHRSGLA